MSSGADLFVVCKQCGSEVSPYVTECPYCGTRLRRRAPKLPRVHAPSDSGSRPSPPQSPRRTRPGRARKLRTGSSRWALARPNATLALVFVSAAVWVYLHAEPIETIHLVLIGPLHGDWWKLLSTQFVYGSFFPGLVIVAAAGIFGWLVEQRHGPAVVIALFLGAGVLGSLAALAVYPFPVVAGANAGALALLGAWAAPDLLSLRAGEYYEGDLLGTAAIALLVLAIPFAGGGASWLAGVVGGLVGLLTGATLRPSVDA